MIADAEIDEQMDGVVALKLDRAANGDWVVIGVPGDSQDEGLNIPFYTKEVAMEFFRRAMLRMYTKRKLAH